MPTEAMIKLHDELSDDLDRIKRRFSKKVKLTLIVRNLEMEDADVFLSDDDFELASAVVRRLEANPSTLAAEMSAECTFCGKSACACSEMDHID